MLEVKLEKVSKLILYLVPSLTLIFIPGFYYPFVLTRTVFFRLLIHLGLSLYFLLLALNFKKYKPRLNLGLKLVTIYLVVQLIAAIFGYNFYKSFWSTFERMEGVVSLIYLAIYLFLLEVFLKQKRDWLIYIRLILITSVLVSLYGVAQKFNLLPLYETGIGRVTSTIGNAAFLAGYLLATVGLGIFYYFNEVRKNYKYFVLMAIGLNLIVLLATSTRGTILGLAAGVVTFLTLNVFFLSGKVRKNCSIVLLTAIIIFGVFYSFRSNLARSEIEVISRIAHTTTADESVNSRFLVWGMALNNFKLHPVLGIGMENFNVVYNKFYTADLPETWYDRGFDRTHNVYLDQLVAGGATVLGAYLAILVYLFFLLFKKKKEDYWQFAVLSSLLVAYSIHNFFVFDTLNTSFLYFFLIGLISLRENADDTGVQNAICGNNAFSWTFIALAVINIFLLFKLVYLPTKINRALYTGYKYVTADTFRSYKNFKYALDHKFGSPESVVQLNIMLDLLESQPDVSWPIRDKYCALLRDKLKVVSDNFPLDVKIKMYLAQLILKNYQNIKELDEAEHLLLDCKKLSPARVETYYLLYNLYSRKGETQKARIIEENLLSFRRR